MRKFNTIQEENHAARLAARICIYALCIFVAVICLFPFFALLITVTKDSATIQSGFSFSLGNNFFDNISNLFTYMDNMGYNIFRSFFNSCVISICSTALCVYFSALTAYACHVYDFKGKEIFEKFILFLIIIPGQLGTVGFFRLVFEMNLQETYIPFIIPAIASPSTVFFLRQYLRSNFSKEYVDAARMDGASEFRIFNMICLPYIKTALATMALFGIISSWNAVMGPLMFITEPQNYTLPQILFFLNANNNPDYGQVYTGVLLTMIPMLVIYFFMSKVIMKGVASGGLK